MELSENLYIRKHHSGFRVVIKRYSYVSSMYPTRDLARRDRDNYLAGVDEVVVEHDTLEDVFFDMMRHREGVKGVRQPTLDYYRKEYRYAVESDLSPTFFPGQLITSISSTDFEDYSIDRRKDGVSLTTIWDHELMIVGMILEHARKRGWMDKNPWSNLDKPKREVKPFPCIPRKRIIDEILPTIRNYTKRADQKSRDANLIEFFFETAIRKEEGAKLRPCDVNFEDRELTIQGKTGIRKIGLEGRVFELAKWFAKGKEPYTNLLANYDTIERAFERWKKRLDEPKLHPHAMRHSFATDAANQGIPVFWLKDYLGHSNISETQKYYHGTTHEARELQRRVQRASPPKPHALPSVDPDQDHQGDARSSAQDRKGG